MTDLKMRLDPAHRQGFLSRLHLQPGPETPRAMVPRVILSFDVEEHYRIEAAAGLNVTPRQKDHYARRLDISTRWLLDQLAARNIRATFFVVAQTARLNPRLVQAIHNAGHEVASHGWDHQRLHNLTPASFAEDIRRSKDALEQVIGEPVVGFRAPTFSIVPQTAWAIDVLVEQGMKYDSSVYPVRHDRYGIPLAPRTPFRASGRQQTILEIPPATLRLLGMNVPVGGGGYFRLFPLFVLERALRQVRGDCKPPVAMLYFHPWEFDPEQARLPLRRLNRFRTYVGISRSRARFGLMLANYEFTRAVDVARQLESSTLPSFPLAG
jgi:polysaccharide deacetylase family protein (PEP-CTERM system associated)